MKPQTQSLNFIYFHVHDLGRYLPVYGVPVDAPHLQAFAEESITFDQAFCASPACTPSRACALSGRYAHSTGCIGLAHMGWPLDLSELTVVDDFNQAGYETALIGVNHERHPRTDRYQLDMTENWDDWATARAVDKAIGFLTTRTDQRPFFLNIGSQQPHASTWHQFADIPEAAERTWLPLWMPDTPKTRADQAMFHAAVRYMDHHFGRFIKALKESTYSTNTVLVFTTDHGISGPRTKGLLYDRGMEISLMVRMPDGTGAGTRRPQLVSNVDFRSTWADLFGIPLCSAVQGCSFAPALGNPEWIGQTRLFSERNFHGEKIPAEREDYEDFYDPIRSVRTQDFHYILNFLPEARPADPLPIANATETPRPPCELYDLRHDPQEMINVASRPEYAEVAGKLDSCLRDWMQATADFLPDGPVPQRPDKPGWGPHWPHG